MPRGRTQTLFTKSAESHRNRTRRYRQRLREKLGLLNQEPVSIETQEELEHNRRLKEILSRNCPKQG